MPYQPIAPSDRMKFIPEVADLIVESVVHGSHLTAPEVRDILDKWHNGVEAKHLSIIELGVFGYLEQVQHRIEGPTTSTED